MELFISEARVIKMRLAEFRQTIIVIAVRFSEQMATDLVRLAVQTDHIYILASFEVGFQVRAPIVATLLLHIDS
jgi:hypothetical protein